MAKPSNHVFVSAGEVSGDIHAAELMKALKHLRPRIVFSGVGGPRMLAAGLRSIAPDMSVYSTAGFLESLRFSFRKSRVLSAGVSYLRKHKIDAVLLVDNQGFNIPLMKAAKKLGLKTLYYFPPHVSIWGGWNAPILARFADLILCPNRADYEVYRRLTDRAFFTGNPLLDHTRDFRPRADFFRRHRLNRKRKTVAIMPGSRYLEMENLLPVMLDAARILLDRHGCQVILPVSHSVFREIVASHLEKKGLTGRVTVLDPGSSYDALHACDAAILSSGTASLEAALFERPPVICYRVSRLTFWIGKKLVRSGMIGLPNLLLGRKAFPELLQEDCNPERIAKETLKFLNGSPAHREEWSRDFRDIRKTLGSPPVVSRIAKKLLTALDHG